MTPDEVQQLVRGLEQRLRPRDVSAGWPWPANFRAALEAALLAGNAGLRTAAEMIHRYYDPEGVVGPLERPVRLRDASVLTIETLIRIEVMNRRVEKIDAALGAAERRKDDGNGV